MSLRAWIGEQFASRHTIFIETELMEQRDKYEKRLDLMHLELSTRETAHAEEIAELKKAHVAELDRVIQECAWLKDEIERLRTFLIPTMQPSYDRVRAANSDEAPPSIPESERGTPFQRMVLKDLEQQDREIAERKRAETASAHA